MMNRKPHWIGPLRKLGSNLLIVLLSANLLLFAALYCDDLKQKRLHGPFLLTSASLGSDSEGGTWIAFRGRVESYCRRGSKKGECWIDEFWPADQYQLRFGRSCRVRPDGMVLRTLLVKRSKRCR